MPLHSQPLLKHFTFRSLVMVSMMTLSFRPFAVNGVAFIPKQRTTIMNVLNQKKGAKTSTAHTWPLGKRCQPTRTSARNKSSRVWTANCWYLEVAYNITTTLCASIRQYNVRWNAERCYHGMLIIPNFWPEQSISRNNVIWFMRGMRDCHLFSRYLNYTMCQKKC